MDLSFFLKHEDLLMSLVYIVIIAALVYWPGSNDTEKTKSIQKAQFKDE